MTGLEAGPKASFADKIRAWRKARGYGRACAVACLSKRLGVDLSLRTLQEWEQGRAVPSGIARVAVERVIQI